MKVAESRPVSTHADHFDKRRLNCKNNNEYSFDALIRESSLDRRVAPLTTRTHSDYSHDARQHPAEELQYRSFAETVYHEEQIQRQERKSMLGSDFLFINNFELKELYILATALFSALDRLHIPYLLIAESLLVAVRSRPITSSNNTIDIAIIDDKYDSDDCIDTAKALTFSPNVESTTQVQSMLPLGKYEQMTCQLPALLHNLALQRNTEARMSAAEGAHKPQSISEAVKYIYHKRPCIACDQVKSSAASRICINIYVLRKYPSPNALQRVVCSSDTERNQTLAPTDDDLSARNLQGRSVHFNEPPITPLLSASPFHLLFNEESLYPIYHFDNRVAIELWPRKYFLPNELLPLKSNYKLGPLSSVSGPHIAPPLLKRFFGDEWDTDCNQAAEISQSRQQKVAKFIGRPLNRNEKTNVSGGQSLFMQHVSHDKTACFEYRQKSAQLYSAVEELPKIIVHNGTSVTPPSLVNEASESSVLGSMARSKSIQSMKLLQGFVQHEQIQSHNFCQPMAQTQIALHYNSHILNSSAESFYSFGTTLRLHTNERPETPVFDKYLRDVMEPYVAKARLKREQTLKKNSRSSLFDAKLIIPTISIGSNMCVPYPTLRNERPFLFDVGTFPLHQILADTIGVTDLSLLHKHPIQDKKRLVDALLHRDTRRAFHECYDNFVTSFCIPLIHALAISQNIFNNNISNRSGSASKTICYRYQAFPCLSIVRPRELSIEPYCDMSQGHSMGNIKFHVPLTPTYGTNALYTESHPGKEDWHPLSTKSLGLGYILDAARCLQFTMDNTTPHTRVSLDFCIAISGRDRRKSNSFPSSEGRSKGTGKGLFPPLSRMNSINVRPEDSVDNFLCNEATLLDQFSEVPGFYEEALIDLGSCPARFFSGPGPILFKRRNDCRNKVSGGLMDPDERVGFPFS